MKKIINGKKYDTETATELARESWNNRSDFNYCAETLYRKKTGEYFIYGQGGAMSRYAIQCSGGSRTSGYAITPVTETCARRWAEENMDGDRYEEVFGVVDE
jgi:hypothetical protein